MPVVLLAFAFQVAWLLTRVILEYDGVAALDARVIALSVAALAASYIALAGAAADLARRLTGKRRAGAWIATAGSLAVVATLVLYEVFIHSSANDPDAMKWAIVLRVHGWSIAESIAIVGFGIAAGRAGSWLAPPAIGLALVHAQPGLTRASWSPAILVVLLLAKGALFVLLARAAEREAAPRAVDRDRAATGLRWLELCAWLGVIVTPALAFAWFARPTFEVAFSSACIGIALAVVFVTAAWSVARAAIPACPRWPMYAASMLSLWTVARMLRSWLVTFARHWGSLEQTPLKTTHWSFAAPSALASIFALAAVAVFARRMARSMWTAVGAIAFVMLAFGVQCSLPDRIPTRVVCYIVANIAAALAFRYARSAVDGHVPRAHIMRA